MGSKSNPFRIITVSNNPFTDFSRKRATRWRNTIIAYLTELSEDTEVFIIYFENLVSDVR